MINAEPSSRAYTRTHETPGSTEEVNAGYLRAFIERIERVSDEIKALNEDKSEIFKEARGNGFHVPALKELLKIRAKDPSKRSEDDAILDVYKQALGMA
jgi:uncharacterized protein (UPF0335 family)